MEIVMRNPLRIAGSAPGRTIERMIAQRDSPKLCPMRIRLRGTLSTPPAVLITVGKNTPNASVAIFDPSPMPNQIMNSGTSAILGIGNSAETTAIPGDRASVNSPTASPSAMPVTVPTVQPTASRSSDALRCAHNSPLRVSDTKDCATPTGAGKNSGGIHPAEHPNCHTASSARIVPTAAQGLARGANPPPRNGTS